MESSDEKHTGEDEGFSDEDDNMEEDEDISLRHYQIELAAEAIRGKNVIIVAPTGSGKTRVALKIIQEHIRKWKGRGIAKVGFLANQVALANQQGDECAKLLKRYTSKVISGETQRMRNECLKDFLDKRDILVLTPQVLLDALVKKEIDSITKFSLLVFDECHHTHANHSFNQIMSIYMDLKLSGKVDPAVLPQIVGLTASVGVGKAKNKEKAVEHITSLMANLDAEKICTVQNNMTELRDYVSIPEEETQTVPGRKNDIFGDGVTRAMTKIENMMSTNPSVVGMREWAEFETTLKSPAQKGTVQYTQWISRLWKETAKLRSQEARRFLNPCRSHLENYNNSLIIYNDARVEDALSYLELAMKKWKEGLIMDKNEEVLYKIYEALLRLPFKDCSTNPKLDALQRLIVKAYRGEDKLRDSRGIVFVKTRDLAIAIVSWMMANPDMKKLNPIKFVGQNMSADKGGMTKVEQIDALKYFRDGKHKLIVATSVAEEGLDISKCNLVIRYDHVTNEIAMVQSRGRGRAQDSKYVVLAEEGTGMAEREELNMIREILMRKAIIHLQERIMRDPVRFKTERDRLQDKAKVDRDLTSISRRGRRIRQGEFELRCLKCDTYVAMSSDIKKIEDAHHVVIDETLHLRVTFKRQPEPQQLSRVTQQAGRLHCMDCGDNLGGLIIHKGIEFPVLAIKNFLVMDMNGRQDTCRHWKNAPFHVSGLTTDDFREMLRARQDGGDI